LGKGISIWTPELDEFFENDKINPIRNTPKIPIIPFNSLFWD